ncbi:Iron/manganese superoxide dismutase, C-terminal domain, partial [Halogranum amylolyticum]
ALDVWEHSYYYDYGPDRGEFVDAFFNVVDWEEPSSRYQQALELFE